MVSAKQASSNRPLGVSGTTQTCLRNVFGRRRNDSLAKRPVTSTSIYETTIIETYMTWYPNMRIVAQAMNVTEILRL